MAGSFDEAQVRLAHRYVAAVWDKLHSEDIVSGTAYSGIATKRREPDACDGNLCAIPCRVRGIDERSHGEAADDDSLQGSSRKPRHSMRRQRIALTKAIALLRLSADRTAKTYEAEVLKNDAASMDKTKGSGFSPRRQRRKRRTHEDT
jgi:hypothetical protein